MNVDLTRKIAGAVMKRSRRSLLQGTIEIDQDWNIDVQELKIVLSIFLTGPRRAKRLCKLATNITSEIEKISDQFSDLEWKT